MSPSKHNNGYHVCTIYVKQYGDCADLVKPWVSSFLEIVTAWSGSWMSQHTLHLKTGTTKISQLGLTTTLHQLCCMKLQKARQQSVPAGQHVPLKHWFQNQLQRLSPTFAAGAVTENNSRLWQTCSCALRHLWTAVWFLRVQESRGRKHSTIVPEWQIHFRSARSDQKSTALCHVWAPVLWHSWDSLLPHWCTTYNRTKCHLQASFVNTRCTQLRFQTWCSSQTCWDLA